MSDRTFIKSVYYIADSKKVNEPDLQVDSRETAQDASPVLQNTAHHQIRVDPAPTKKAALPRVPEHYFAPKPVIDKPLIESAYCYTANTVHYYADGPKRNEAQQFLDEEIQSSSPVAATLPTTLGLNSPVANFKQYGDHYDPLSAKHPSATYAAVTSPIEKNAPHQQTPVNAKRQVEVSEYAWRRLDEEKMNQYAIAPPSQDAEKETPPPVIKVTIPPAVKQPVEVPAEKQIGMANDQKGSSEKPDVPCEKEYKLPAESEYVAIPNDLYPAYRKATDYSSSVRVTAVPQSPDVVADDISCSDLDKCETAKENLPFRSRFKTLIEPKETRPVASSAPRYTIQHSPIGNAFSPVGQPQISEYQLEDLNDLASCIDAL